MPDIRRVVEGLERCLPMTTRNGLADCKQCPYDRKITLEGGITECCYNLMADALALLKAQEPPTSESISSAIECLLHPQDADDSDMAKAIDTAVRAMMLLKVKEPRVMTLSGVRGLKESTPVWLEDVDKKDVIGALFMRDYSGTKCVDFAIVRDWEFERVVADYMDYGVRWRCWTSSPTEAEREAIKWE